jgi:hypothetical protein
VPDNTVTQQQPVPENTVKQEQVVAENTGKQEQVVPAQTVKQEPRVPPVVVPAVHADNRVETGSLPGAGNAPVKPAGQGVKPAYVAGDCGSSIQVGAFHFRGNAYRSRKRLEAALRRSIVIVNENNYFKVRVPGFSSTADAESLLPALAGKGFPETFFVEDECIFIQVGAFRYEDNAVKVRHSVESSTGRRVVIVLEDGFYKVRIKGFKGLDDAREFLPGVISGGYSDAFILSGR